MVSTINAAVEARITSSMKDQRVAASKILQGPPSSKPFEGDRQGLIDAVRDALYASKIVSYAQGMDLLGAAGKLNTTGTLNFGDIATIWRGGCIIRARFLDRIKEAYDRNPSLGNLMLDSVFHRCTDQEPTQLAACGLDGSDLRRGCPGVQRLARVLRQLPAGASARQPAPGTARLSSARIPTSASISPGVFHTEWLQEHKDLPDA